MVMSHELISQNELTLDELMEYERFCEMEFFLVHSLDSSFSTIMSSAIVSLQFLVK